MCGICGIFNFNDTPVDDNNIYLMLDQMKSRGPDGCGVFFGKNVAIGMRRLSILDLQGGSQPISNETKTVYVVLNGEIYNYIELRSDLIKRGHQFSTCSDTEILVHLYEEYGIDCVKHLNGMFAFALYDKSSGQLWLVRDRLGIKPLYYYLDKARIVFASDLTALNKVVGDHVLNEKSLYYYLMHNYVANEETIFLNYKKLPPAHWAKIERQEVSVQQYWQVLNYNGLQLSRDEIIARLDALLLDAVRIQTRSDVPLAVSLSGGMDSSAVVMYAADITAQPINTFTVNFCDKESEDIYFSRKVSHLFATNHREVSFDSRELLGVLDSVIKGLDEPIADSAILSSFILSKIVKEEGIKVLLTGAGGDEVFGGYSRYAPGVKSPLWLAENLPKPLGWIFSNFIGRLNADVGMRISDPKLAFLFGTSGVNIGVLSEMLKEQDVFIGMLKSVMNEMGVISHEVTSKMSYDLTHYLVGDILALTDKTTMANSVEARVPLLDHRIVELMLSLSGEDILHARQLKSLLCCALTKKLPHDLLYRKKEGFNAPIPEWFKDDFKKEIKREILVDTIPIYKEIFDLAKIDKCINISKRQHAMTFFNLFVFSRWYKSKF